MKKAGRILSLVIILVLISSAFCFGAEGGAGKLVLEKSTPEDGQSGTSLENLGVKLYFDSEFTKEKLGDINDKTVKLYSEDGVNFPVRVLYSPKEKGVVLVLFDTTKATKKTVVEGNKKYTLDITSQFRDDAGNTLEKDIKITFKTLNQSVNMAVNAIMMVVMMGGIMLISAKSAKKNAEEQKRQRDEKVNPYKESKRTGKSVEEIVEKDQKQKAKKAAKEARKAAKEADEDEEYYEEGLYRVKAPRPISEGGGKYITGRKAIAEAKKAQQEAWDRAAANKKRKAKKK